jgi:hypothetical protein
MSKPIVLQDKFERMVRDKPRSRMASGECWNLVDWIPGGEIDAPAAKRGGWAYASNALTGILASADRVNGLIYAEFSGGAQLVTVAKDDGTGNTRLGQIVSTSSTTDRGATVNPLDRLVFYRDKVYIADSSGTVTPQTYDGSSNATNLAGTPPTGSRMTVYKDRLVLAKTVANNNRIWFSAAGNPASWDTSLRYIDTSAEVTGMYALRNAILVFHPANMERIIGTIPPPGSDMSLQPMSDVGTLYPRSFAGTDEFMVFANGAGVYMTDGSAVADLTSQGHMRSYWQQQTTAASASLQLGGGFFRGYYFVTIGNGVSTFVDALACEVASRRWFRLGNITAHPFARRTSGMEELDAHNREGSRV